MLLLYSRHTLIILSPYSHHTLTILSTQVDWYPMLKHLWEELFAHDDHHHDVHNMAMSRAAYEVL